MSATPQTVSDFVRLAREAILAKDFDAAETYKQQAQALKSISDLDLSPDTSQRLPFPASGVEGATKTAQELAMSMWYAKTYGGDLDKDTATVLVDIYGHDYRHLRYAKTMDFLRYIRTGVADPKLHRLALYTPAQVMEAIAGGEDVKGIKATQVESQDTLGKHTCRFVGRPAMTHA